jgi:hypothetical protein
MLTRERAARCLTRGAESLPLEQFRFQLCSGWRGLRRTLRESDGAWRSPGEVSDGALLMALRSGMLAHKYLYG